MSDYNNGISDEEEFHQRRSQMLRQLPNLASGKKGGRTTGPVDPALRSLSQVIDSLDETVREAKFGGTSVFRNILVATGKMAEIEQDDEDDHTVFLPADHYFNGDNSSRIRPVGPPRVRNMATENLDRNVSELKELAEMHIASGQSGLKEILEGRSTEYTDDSVPVVQLQTQWGQHNEDGTTQNFLVIKAPRTQAKHYRKPPGFADATGKGGFLPPEHFDRPRVEAELRSDGPFGEPYAVKYASSNVIAVEQFANGHVVVIDRALSRPEESEL